MFFKKYIIILFMTLISLFFVSLIFYKNQIKYFFIGNPPIINIVGEGLEYKVLPDDSLVDIKEEGMNFPGVDLDVYRIVNEKILPDEKSLNIDAKVNNTEKNKVSYNEDKIKDNSSDISIINSLNENIKYYIQLASFEEKKQAENLKNTFLNYEEKIFKQLSYRVSLVDIKNKGIFFRLLAGPFQNQQRALSICEDIKKMKISCFAIKEF